PRSGFDRAVPAQPKPLAQLRHAGAVARTAIERVDGLLREQAAHLELMLLLELFHRVAATSLASARTRGFFRGTASSRSFWRGFFCSLFCRAARGFLDSFCRARG